MINKPLGKLQSIAKSAFSDLADQSSPFGRLALTHVLMIAGDTLVTVSLAGSLFFSISPHAAQGHIILYLLLTMAPFSLVAPFLGPVLDRGKSARRVMVVSSAFARVILCFLMANDVNSILLFPEAFGLLVASKVYVVTRGALVPEMADSQMDLATANARLAFLAAVAGMVSSLPAALILELFKAQWVLRLDMVIYVLAAVAGMRLKRSKISEVDVPDSRKVIPGGVWSSPEAFLALSAMSVLRGAVGFLTFLIAFSFRRSSAGTWEYGVVLALSAIGSLIGTLLVSRLKRRLKEQSIMSMVLLALTVISGLSAYVGGLAMDAVLTFTVGLGVAISRPSLDSLVQNLVPFEAQGRAFARVETQLQLVWVLGSLLPVIISMPINAGQALLAAVLGVGAASYLTGRRALIHYDNFRKG